MTISKHYFLGNSLSTGVHFFVVSTQLEKLREDPNLEGVPLSTLFAVSCRHWTPYIVMSKFAFVLRYTNDKWRKEKKEVKPTIISLSNASEPLRHNFLLLSALQVIGQSCINVEQGHMRLERRGVIMIHFLGPLTIPSMRRMGIRKHGKGEKHNSNNSANTSSSANVVVKQLSLC
jgi:hypothetical protein